MVVNEKKKFKPEEIAYWFFRLNGCLTIVNLVIHPDLEEVFQGMRQRTDVDILAVRFPYRCELGMKDYGIIFSNDKIDIIIAEVKSGRCNLNGPWVSSERKNMQRVLKFIGALEENKIEKAAKAIYNEGKYCDEKYCIKLLMVGKEKNKHLQNKYPAITQIFFDEILGFIWERFNTYKLVKSSHPQWDSTGKELFSLATYRYKEQKEEFIKHIIGRF